MPAPWPYPLRILNKRLVQVQERLFRNAAVLGRPFAIALEPGNACNLRCPLCATTFREPEIPRGFLTLDAARAVLDRFPALVHLNLSMWGEPFLNPDLCEVIALARRRKIDVLVQSNFSLEHFDRAFAERLVASDLNHLQLSIDGTSQATYERFRRRGRLATVLRNLATLRSVQSDRRSANPRVTWKMIVHRYNEHEVPVAREMAAAYGADFSVIEIYVPKGMEEKWKPRGSAWRSGNRLHRDIGGRCHYLWQFMAVNFNGDVFPCCNEWSPQEALGNVLRQPSEDVWNSAEYRRRRANNRTGPPRCDDCHADKTTNFWRQWHLGEKNPAMDPDADGVSHLDVAGNCGPPELTAAGESPAAPDLAVPAPRA